MATFKPIPLATDAETVTGTSTTKVTTPASLTAKMAAPGAIGGTTPNTGNFTTLAITGLTSTGTIALNTPTVADKNIVYRVNNSARWNFYVNNTAESGSNAGSNFALARYSDAGAFLGTALSAERATGNVTFNGNIIAASNIELGHASDTTISRVSAGKIAVEGKEIIDASSPQTATNKVVTNVNTTAPATPAAGMLWWDTDDTSNPGGDLAADHISEATAGHGVDVDGVTMKDGDITGETARLQTKIITATRDAGAASGDVAYTGVGFTPTSIKCFMNVDAGPYQSISESDSTKTAAGIYTSASGVQYQSATIASYTNYSAWAQNAVIKSYNADGFTLTWTKVGTPTAGTIKLSFVCKR